jgi:hypothetical protein
MATQTMKAVNYQGPYKVQVQDIELPKLEHPDDVIVKVTTVRFQISHWETIADICVRLPFVVPTYSKYRLPKQDIW